ncbi:unnamed protein product, partial [Brassica rapa]
MAQSNWESDKMLDVYIYDHLVKKKLHNTAKSFMAEGKVSTDPVANDTPGGFLFERWSMFLDIYKAKTKEKLLDSAVEYELNVYIFDYLVKKKLHHTALSFMSEVEVSMDPVAIDTPGGYLSDWWSVFWAFFVASTNEKHSESAAEAHQGGVSAAIQSRTQQTPLINMPQVHQSSSQQQDPFQSQQKPSTPSTYTPVERVAITRNMPKGPMMYGYDANQLGYEVWADMDPFGDVGALDDEDLERVINIINGNPFEYYIEAQQNKAKEQQIQMKQPNPMNTETSQPGTTYHGEMDQGNHQGGHVSAALQQLKSRTQQTPVITLLDRIFFSVLVTFLHCTKHTGAKVGSWRRRVTVNALLLESIVLQSHHAHVQIATTYLFITIPSGLVAKTLSLGTHLHLLLKSSVEAQIQFKKPGRAMQAKLQLLVAIDVAATARNQTVSRNTVNALR